MTGPSFAVVCTTIGDGSFLKHYAKALEGADARMYVIPDRKTPKALYDAVREHRATARLSIKCPDPDMQQGYLDDLGAPDGFFPWDTDHRRNVGYLMAYESGADIVISVDDDNLPQPGWLADHAKVLAAGNFETVFGNRFFNPCCLLDVRPVMAPARGYPYSQWTGNGPFGWSKRRQDVAINAGLWLGDPDVGAMTRLTTAPHAAGLVETEAALASEIWAPVNSQNTAVRREVIPAYYFFRSARFGDIYQGYLAQACAKHLGHSVRFGTPVVRHERNDHDLLADLEAELPDIRRVEPWLDWLTSAKPEGSTYADAYASLAEQMPQSGKAAEMRTWLKLCRRIG